MEKFKDRPALRMIKRLVYHISSKDELQELWDVSLRILSYEERHIFLITVLVKFQSQLPNILEL